jgi:cobyrinic acid a,c-diamide synthase
LPYSGIVVSAPFRSSGKTTISTGLCAALKERGYKVKSFKKGPDYIDPMWLSAASGSECSNLDFFLMGPEKIKEVYLKAGLVADFAVVEGNMGFYDGMDPEGKDTTDSLSRLLNLPVILVVDASRMTRGVAPLLLGYKTFEPDNKIEGIILNKIANPRHEEKLKLAISKYCNLKIFGALPVSKEIEITQRHLGLVPFNEDPNLKTTVEKICDFIKRYVDLEGLIALSKDFKGELLKDTYEPKICVKKRIRLGIARDRVFTFYYKENLDALKNAGAELIFFDTLYDEFLPDVDGLYFGGGFPEIFMDELSQNTTLMRQIRKAGEDGMPIYAECGGLMYLSRSMIYKGKKREMVGAIPAEIEVFEKPKGHGYVILEETGKSKWFCFGGQIRGHEFHYSQIRNLGDIEFAYRVIRGNGVDGRHDGIIYKNILASYVHIHSLSSLNWAEDFVSFVQDRAFPYRTV